MSAIGIVHKIEKQKPIPIPKKINSVFKYYKTSEWMKYCNMLRSQVTERKNIDNSQLSNHYYIGVTFSRS